MEKGVANSLLRKPEEAQAAVDAGDFVDARNIFSAFIVEVRTQRGKHISGTAADLLTADAMYVRDGL